MLSVIIPMYNVEDKICRTINSIMKQNLEDYEVIIVDDCSKDNSYNVCKKYIEDNKLEKFTLLKNDENHGPSYTRNRGIKEAKGDYGVLLDSDDYYEEDTINTMLKYMKPKTLVVVGVKYIYKKNKIKYMLYGEKDEIINIGENEFIKFHLTGLLNQPSNKIYDLNYIKQNNILFNESSAYGEDIEFNFEYTENINEIIYINKPLYVYTESENGLNNTYKENELIVVKNNFKNKLEKYNTKCNMNKNIEIDMYRNYIKERIRLYYRCNKYDSRENKKEYLLKCKLYYLARIYSKIFI